MQISCTKIQVDEFEKEILDISTFQWYCSWLFITRILMKLRPGPHYAGGIWNWFHSENASSVFRQHYAAKILKHSNHQPFCIWVRGKLGQGKSLAFKMILSTLKRTAGVLKILRFGKRLREVPFSWRTIVNGRPNRRKRCCFQISPALCGRCLS